MFCLLVCFMNCLFSVHFCTFFCTFVVLSFLHQPNAFIFQVPASPTLDQDLLHIMLYFSCVSQNSWKSVVQCVSSHKSQSIVRTPWVSTSDTAVSATMSKPATHFQKEATKIPMFYTSRVQAETHSRDTVEGSFIRDHLKRWGQGWEDQGGEWSP